MVALKNILVCTIITLSCISVLELVYTFYILATNFDDFTLFELSMTFIFNFAIIFFAIATIHGVKSENLGLLSTCLIFFILELMRMTKGLIELWTSDDDENTFNRFFITLDAGKKQIIS